MAKADIVKRVVAYVIDSIIASALFLAVFAVSFVVFMVGLLMMNILTAITSVVYIVGIGASLLMLFAYLIFRDGFFGGRSIGKKLMGLKVINTKTNKPCSLKDSFLRNITLVIPILNVIDLLVPFIDPEGLRFGDKLAGTKVVE